MAEELVYCRRCAHFHARPQTPPVARRQMVLGTVLYGLLRAAPGMRGTRG